MTKERKQWERKQSTHKKTMRKERKGNMAKYNKRLKNKVMRKERKQWDQKEHSQYNNEKTEKREQGEEVNGSKRKCYREKREQGEILKGYKNIENRRKTTGLLLLLPAPFPPQSPPPLPPIPLPPLNLLPATHKTHMTTPPTVAPRKVVKTLAFFTSVTHVEKRRANVTRMYLLSLSEPFPSTFLPSLSNPLSYRPLPYIFPSLVPSHYLLLLCRLFLTISFPKLLLSSLLPVPSL